VSGNGGGPTGNGNGSAGNDGDIAWGGRDPGIDDGGDRRAEAPVRRARPDREPAGLPCGVPDANTAFRIAQRVLAELDEAPSERTGPEATQPARPAESKKD
jgi:hypothetical protein